MERFLEVWGRLKAFLDVWERSSHEFLCPLTPKSKKHDVSNLNWLHDFMRGFVISKNYLLFEIDKGKKYV